jgi:glutathione synthase/RimK-type ligase-like ATP-grasp enzyme
MIIGIHPDKIGDESYSAKWAEYLRARGVEAREVDLLAGDALEQAKACNGVMWRWAHYPNEKQSASRILYAIEHALGLPVFPNSRTAWHYDEKVSQHYLLQSLGAPVAPTWVFWDQAEALVWAQTAPYPVVFKLSAGAGSSNVLKVDGQAQAEALIRRMFTHGVFPMTMNEFRRPAGLPRTRAQLGAFRTRARHAAGYLWRAEYPPLPGYWKPEYGYAYFQAFLPDNAFDTRVTVIGNRAFAFRRMNRPGDFRASGSGLLDYDQAAVDRRTIDTAFAVSARGGFQSMAYDFLYQDGEPRICEISYTFLDRAVHACPGHWDRDGAWHEGRRWPEEAQVEDFLAEVCASRERRHS